MPVHAVKVEWATHRDKLRAIRHRVFIEEQSVPKRLEWDGLDESATHFLALNEDGAGAGHGATADTPGRSVGWRCSKEQRGRGIGRQLLEAAIDHAVAVGMERVFLHAQRTRKGSTANRVFDRRAANSWRPGSHIEMEHALPIPFKPSTPDRGLPLVNPARERRKISQTQSERCDPNRLPRAVVELIAKARRKVLILSPNLDTALFAHPPMLAAIPNLRAAAATHRPRFWSRTRKRSQRAHPLLELARRVPSKIEMRRLPDEHVPTRNFIVVDDAAIWVQTDPQAYLGWFNLNDRVEARRLSDEFIALYERAPTILSFGC